MSLFKDAIEVVSTTVTVPDGSGTSSSFVRSVSAPTGKKVLGGGARDTARQVNVRYSYPESDGSAWIVDLLNQSGSSQSVDVYAVCVG